MPPAAACRCSNIRAGERKLCLAAPAGWAVLPAAPSDDVANGLVPSSSIALPAPVACLGHDLHSSGNEPTLASSTATGAPPQPPFCQPPAAKYTVLVPARQLKSFLHTFDPARLQVTIAHPVRRLLVDDLTPQPAAPAPAPAPSSSSSNSSAPGYGPDGCAPLGALCLESRMPHEPLGCCEGLKCTWHEDRGRYYIWCAEPH